MNFVMETRIAATPGALFAFHESPGALQSLIPPWEKVRVVEGGGSLLPGSRVTLRTKLGPLWLDWVAEHFEYDPPHHFADRQLSGPFARWVHHHRFLDDGRGGSILRDEVDFAPPLGWLGRVLAGRFVRRKLERMFAFRHQVTKDRVEAGEFSVA